MLRESKQVTRRSRVRVCVRACVCVCDITDDSSPADVGDYDQTSIRYTGRNIPSRSFRMLQHLTGGADDVVTPPGTSVAVMTRQFAVPYFCYITQTAICFTFSALTLLAG